MGDEKRELSGKIEYSNGVTVLSKDVLKFLKLMWKSVEEESLSLRDICLIVILVLNVISVVLGVINYMKV